MHNGQIGEFAAVKRRLENLLPDQLYNARHGNTDSELIFLLLLHFGIDQCPGTAIDRMLETIRNSGNINLNRKRLEVSEAAINRLSELPVANYEDDTKKQVSIFKLSGLFSKPALR